MIEKGTVIGDMHGRNSIDILNRGLSCLYWHRPDAGKWKHVKAIQFPGKDFSKFIEANTGRGYCNKDLVVIGENYEGVVTAYSYDGHHAGIITFEVPS